MHQTLKYWIHDCQGIYVATVIYGEDKTDWNEIRMCGCGCVCVCVCVKIDKLKKEKAKGNGVTTNKKWEEDA